MVNVLREVLDSDVNSEISSDDNRIENISSESCEEDEGSGRQLETHVGKGNTSCPVAKSTETSSSAVSLLSILKAPKPSDLSRKRSVFRNPPPRGKRKCRGNLTNDPTRIKPYHRVKEYPNEPFVVSNNKLFCNGCHEELCINKSSVKYHIASEKHKKGKGKLQEKTAKEKDLAISL